MTEGTGTPFNMPVVPAGMGGYVSRDRGSYDDGYNNGYSQAMREMNQNGGNSGHLPMNPYYPEQRRW